MVVPFSLTLNPLNLISPFWIQFQSHSAISSNPNEDLLLAASSPGAGCRNGYVGFRSAYEELFGVVTRAVAKLNLVGLEEKPGSVLQ